MEPHVLRQMRGAVDLAQEAVAATVDAIAEAHLDIAAMPYAVLERIPVIAQPAVAIGQVQRTITIGVYAAIRGVNWIVGSAAASVVDRWAEPPRRTASPQPGPNSLGSPSTRLARRPALDPSWASWANQPATLDADRHEGVRRVLSHASQTTSPHPPTD
jgi:hypothetical protein